MSKFISQDSPLENSAFVPLKGRCGSTCDAFVKELSGQKFFIKRLKPDLENDPVYRAFFKKEYEIGSSLHHKGLAHYEEFHVGNDGVWIEQEYVVGETLSQRLEKDPGYFCKSGSLEKFTVQLLSVLEYLHFNKVIHLDINPNNIIFRKVDDSLMLLDLGFCYTDQYSRLIGRTDAFAAPEQYVDAANNVDCRTDLFAVGMILKTIKTISFPGKRLPLRFDRLMRKCLQQKKEDRPVSAEECMRMLRKDKIASMLVCSICAVVAAILCLVPVLRKSSLQFRDANDVMYQIVSRENQTCWAVGHVQDPDDEHTAYLRSEVPYKGKMYRVTEIGPMAFQGRSDMESIYIPEGIVKVAESAFRYDSLMTTISIPESVTFIGQRAFANMVSLKVVKLPSGLKRLESESFFECNNLQRINIPSGVEFIGRDCFVSCWNLTDVQLPDSLKILDRGVFYNCTSLQQISIPAGVNTIGEYAFMNCPSLTDIYIYAKVPPTSISLFDRHGITVHVPAVSADLYSTDPVWSAQGIVGDL